MHLYKKYTYSTAGQWAGYYCQYGFFNYIILYVKT